MDDLPDPSQLEQVPDSVPPAGETLHFGEDDVVLEGHGNDRDIGRTYPKRSQESELSNRSDGSHNLTRDEDAMYADRAATRLVTGLLVVAGILCLTYPLDAGGKGGVKPVVAVGNGRMIGKGNAGERRMSHPVSTVRQWDRFEAVIRNTAEYPDPYRDVTLEVTWRRPDGTAVEFWGFHDGGKTWRIRFMPDQTGLWKYEARFSDGRPGAAGEFRCVASDLPGMIAVDAENPMWFGYTSGQHELLRAFHVGDRFFAANWPKHKRKAFLDWLTEQGYNTLSIASHYLNRDAKGRGRGWDTPRLWPLDAGEYRRMEAILDDLARRRILLFPFAGFFGQSSDYPRGPEEQERYVRYTLARLGPYWNLLLNVAGPEPNVGRGWMPAEEVERLGRLIRRLDPFGHLVSVHNRTGDDPYRDSNWTTYGVLQGPKTVDRQVLHRGLLANHHPRKPLLAQETLWSGNVNHIRRIGRDYSDNDLRKNAFVIQMSAAALVFADNDGNSSSGFSGSMDLEDCRQERHDVIRRVWDFFETVPFHRLEPRQDLADGGFCLAQEGVEYLVYLESPGRVNVRVTPGDYTVEWINARETSDVRSGGRTTDGQGLLSPEGGDDWLLRLRRDSAPRDGASALYFPPPGEGLDVQSRRTPEQVGLKPEAVKALSGKADRWALWRSGHLVHVEGEWNRKRDVASLRKTWHALTVGAAIHQGKIPSCHQRISVWEKGLSGNDALATWWHVITQSSAFDYPYGDRPDYRPGEIWTYSDKNPVRLCNGLAKAYGNRDYHDHYEDVLSTAYFDAIGMRGWSIGFTRKDDGIRLHLDLEDMGRLGLLVLARGRWKGQQVIPQWFVEDLERKQTAGMKVNYDGPDDGKIGLDPKRFPEAPYGYMTWVNTAGDFYPGADRAWAWGSGAGGNVIYWNRNNGIVYAAQRLERDEGGATRGVPHLIEDNIVRSAKP